MADPLMVETPQAWGVCFVVSVKMWKKCLLNISSQYETEDHSTAKFNTLDDSLRLVSRYFLAMKVFPRTSWGISYLSNNFYLNRGLWVNLMY